MKKIQHLVEEIDDELNGAKEYAEAYLENKASGEQQRANTYRGMADDELRHAESLHEITTQEVQKLKQVYTPPAEMEEKWTAAHRKYIEKAAWIKQMLSM